MTILKLLLGEEIRRVGKAPETINEVKSRTSRIFGIEDPSFRYKDEDGDLITIQTQEEYQDALKLCAGTIKLEVLDSQVLLMKRSTFMMSSFTSTPSDTLNAESMERSLKHLNRTAEIQKGETEKYEAVNTNYSVNIQTESIIFKEDSTETSITMDKGSDAIFMSDFSTQCEYNTIADFQDFLREIIGNNLPKPGIRVKNNLCSACGLQIRGVKYECKFCNINMCEICEKSTEHMHPLLKIKPSEAFVPIKPIEAHQKKPINIEYIQSKKPIDAEFVRTKKPIDLDTVPNKIPTETHKPLKKPIEIENFSQDDFAEAVQTRKPLESGSNNTFAALSKKIPEEAKKYIKESPQKDPEENYVVLGRDCKETPRGHRENLSELIKKLRVMGFNDENKSVAALIKANYVMEIATEFLLDQT
mmetsp:Transcript_15399/g.15377  ORF Transcript_15399/g.15377 Transcript_15399/m.15377 type:complete len:417 (-) Transcript_15399:25-1275(-)